MNFATVFGMVVLRLIQRSMAWSAPSTMARQSRVRNSMVIRREMTTTRIDDEGRKIRNGPRRSNDWDDFDNDWDDEPRGKERPGGQSRRTDSSDWEDFDPFSSPKRGPSHHPRNHNHQKGRGGNRKTDNHRRQHAGDHRRNNRGTEKLIEKGPETRKVNMKALEGAGFVHLYGLASVLNALSANRRDFTRPEDTFDLDELSPEAYEMEVAQRRRKPEAQFSPYLFVQERNTRGGRTTDKAIAAEEVERQAQEQGVPIAHVDKGVLNTLCNNRPHQGYVLRCGPLDFTPLTTVPLPSPSSSSSSSSPRLWLCLDEVVDPQNLGALLRSAHFLGGPEEPVGVLVCAKNSAPPSPVVSAASAGALELLDVHSTSNLPKTLNRARGDGFRVIGASSSLPNTDAEVHELNQLPADDRPVILVLGSEGHGLRTLVAKACTDFVKIPRGGDGDEGSVVGVDSLNVSVTGGILLWQLLNMIKK